MKHSGRWMIIVLLGAWVLAVAGRVTGPSDLYDKEQPRTISYTAHILVHGNWILPRDSFDIPSTKVPLYNWLSVPVVSLFGWHEWTLKAPSVAASLGVVGFLVLAGRKMRAGWPSTGISSEPAEKRAEVTDFGMLAGLVWLSSLMTDKLLYLARPDMLVTAFLTGAWYAATQIVLRTSDRRETGAVPAKPPFGMQMLYWSCVMGAAFAKGPNVIPALLYLPLLALAMRKPAALWRCGWWWGLPLCVGIVGAWTAAAYHQNPEFFKVVFVEREMVDRVTDPWALLKTFFNGPGYMISRFLPWSLAALALLVTVRPKQWRAHPAFPALVWVLLIFVAYSFLSTKRPDRYAPVFPQMALLATWSLMELPQRFRPRAAVAAIAILIIVSYSLYDRTLSSVAKDRYGDHAIAFAGQVRKVVSDDETILFEDGEQTPLQTLLGRAQPLIVPPEMQQQARWAIRFVNPGQETQALVISDPLAQVDGPNAGRLGLYHLAPGEGVTAYAQARTVPRLYVGPDDQVDPEVLGSPDERLKHQWQQFWRVHTQPASATHASTQ